MWLESQPGAGTTFFVDLPIAGPIEHTARPGHQIREDWIWVERRSRPELPESHFKPRMVICDETGDLCPALTHCSDEIEFINTGSLPEATQELARCPAEALVVNAAWPDGLWPLVETVTEQMPHMPVIGCSYPRQMEHALRAGAIEQLIKPVTCAQVRAAIEAAGRPVRRVLVVDDDADTRELLALYMQAIDGGIEVLAAASGEQSLAEMRARPPDLIFLDIVLPDIDGWQVLDAKARDEALRDVPTVIISAQDAREGPATSKVLLATVGGGLSTNKLLACSTSLVKLLLEP
jgi:CheY-like chemotaxis protein